MDHKTIVLIGPRGSGKTTVGRLLAERTNSIFFDTDELIQARAGRTIAAIFEQDGEAAFRRLEAEIIAALEPPAGAVISAGGGAVAHKDTRARLAGMGLVVWLTAEPAELHRRLIQDQRSAAARPPLTDKSARAEIEAVLAARRPFYQELAQSRVDTTRRTVNEVVDAILELVH